MVLFEVLGRTAQETDAIARAVESALAAEGTEGAVRRFAEVSPDVLASWGVRELPFVRRENRVLCQGRIPGPDEIRAWLRLPRTVDEAVAWLLAEIGDDDRDIIRGKGSDDLVDLHPTLGFTRGIKRAGLAQIKSSPRGHHRQPPPR